MGPLPSFFPKFFTSSDSPPPIHNKGKEWIANLLLIHLLTANVEGGMIAAGLFSKSTTGIEICQAKGGKEIGSGLLPPARSFPIRPVTLMASVSQQSETPGDTDRFFPPMNLMLLN